MSFVPLEALMTEYFLQCCLLWSLGFSFIHWCLLCKIQCWNFLDLTISCQQDGQTTITTHILLQIVLKCFVIKLLRNCHCSTIPSELTTKLVCMITYTYGNYGTTVNQIRVIVRVISIKEIIKMWKNAC